jgi:hypothetical protein
MSLNSNYGPAPKPITTVQRLRLLRPGQAIVYYRGDLAYDIARAGCAGGAAAYAKVLCDIRDTVGELVRLGRVKISERRIDGHGGHLGHIEYIAVGVS